MDAIVLEDLRKEYRNGRGIHGLTLRVGRGEIFGFLGPNGAGKTTTIRTLLGLLRPDGGRAWILGRDIAAESLSVRRITGYLPGEPALYDYLSGEENLRFSLYVRGCPERWARGLDLARRLGVDLRPRLRSLSHGQRQKVAIILALAHEPDVLILDEPTTGLDPLAQESFFGIIREERGAGKTIFMSSHVLPEVEALCGRVGIIRDGRLVEVNEVEALRRNRFKRVAAVFKGTPPDLSRWPGVSGLAVDGERVSFAYQGEIPPLLRILAGQDLADLTMNDPSLEEVFRAFYRDGGEGGR